MAVQVASAAVAGWLLVRVSAVTHNVEQSKIYIPIATLQHSICSKTAPKPQKREHTKSVMI